MINKVIRKLFAFIRKRPQGIISVYDTKVETETLDFVKEYKETDFRNRFKNDPSDDLKEVNDLSFKRVSENCTKIEVFTLNKGQYFHKYGRCLVLQNDYIIDELSYAGYFEPNKNLALTVPFFPKKRYLKGRVLCLCCTGAESNYFTFHLKLIQRIGFIKKVGLRLEDFDKILINHSSKKYQLELLEYHGVSEEKIICVKEGDFIESETLIVPTIGLQSLIGVDFLREAYKPLMVEAPSKRYYVSRSKAKWMKVVDDSILTPFLDKYSIQTVFLEDLSVTEQIKLFSDAEIIITPHGAGLANVLFMNKDSLVIEIMNKKRIHVGYHAYAVLNNLYYGFIRCESEENEFSNGKESTKNLIVTDSDISKLDSIIKWFLTMDKS